MKIVLVHGIHEKEGNNNMSVLWPYLQRHTDVPIELFSYGFMGFWQARWRNKEVAKRLAERIDPGDIVITHSNGHPITFLAQRDHGARPFGVIGINPAFDRWRTIAAEWVEVIASDGDRAVWWSQWLPGHLWGDQGRVGYRGQDLRTLTHHASKFLPPLSYEHHSELFSQVRVNEWAQFIANRIHERIDERDYYRKAAADLRAHIEANQREIAA